jgi:FtsP/CotA-like multicopper oxidase with cupredoxin domain
MTRRQAVVGAAPVLIGLAPLANAALADSSPGTDGMTGMDGQMAEHHAASLHASMMGDAVPAPEGPDHVLTPPAAYEPGPVRTYDMVATEQEIEVAKGVFFPAWAYGLKDGPATVPGPTIRVTEGQTLRVNFTNGSSHPHTIHFHGIHPADMDGVFEIVEPGGRFVYEFPARPAGMHLYHCHATPLKKHIEKGLYGALIIDPKTPRSPAQEMVMVMNGFDTNGDAENEFYTVNGRAFYYARHPIRVRRDQTVRIYLANLTEFDLMNSFHLHGEFFRYYPTGTTDQFEYTDTVMLGQGQRGIIEIDFHNTGHFMFHAHVSEFTELGWMGFFDVVDR